MMNIDNSTFCTFYQNICQVVSRDSDTNLNFLSSQNNENEDSEMHPEVFHENGRELSFIKVDTFAKNSSIIYVLRGETHSKEYIFAASKDEKYITDLINRLIIIIDKYFSEFSTKNMFCGEKIPSQKVPAYFFVRSQYSLFTSIRYKEILSLDEKISSVFPSKSNPNKNRKVEMQSETGPKGYFEVPIAFSSQIYIANSLASESQERRPKSPDPQSEVSYDFGFSEDYNLIFDQ